MRVISRGLANLPSQAPREVPAGASRVKRQSESAPSPCSLAGFFSRSNSPGFLASYWDGLLVPICPPTRWRSMRRNLYIADMSNQRFRKVDAVSQIITTVAGNGTQRFLRDQSPPAPPHL